MTHLPEALVQRLLAFRAERDWEQFHNARSLSTALSVEAAEPGRAAPAGPPVAPRTTLIEAKGGGGRPASNPCHDAGCAQGA